MQVTITHFSDSIPPSRPTLFQATVCKTIRGCSRVRQMLVTLLCLGALGIAQAQTWSTATVPAGVTPQDANHTFATVAHNGTKFVASGGELDVISSTDGITWTYDGKMAAVSLVKANAITWIPFLSKWVAGTNVNLATNVVIYTSSNGIAWTQTNSGLANVNFTDFATDGTTVIGTVSSVTMW